MHGLWQFWNHFFVQLSISVCISKLDLFLRRGRTNTEPKYLCSDEFRRQQPCGANVYLRNNDKWFLRGEKNQFLRGIKSGGQRKNIFHASCRNTLTLSSGGLQTPDVVGCRQRIQKHPAWTRKLGTRASYRIVNPRALTKYFYFVCARSFPVQFAWSLKRWSCTKVWLLLVVSRRSREL